MRQTLAIKNHIPHLIAVMGPTASGKSALAEALADEIDAQLVNADAFQVYRGFDIGTAKPKHRERYQLLDLCDPREAFGVGEFVLRAVEVLERCFLMGRNVVLVGGSGLYVRALMEEYDNLCAEPPAALREEIGRLSLDEAVAQLEKAAPESLENLDRLNPRRVRRALEKARTPGGPITFKLPAFRKTKIGLVLPSGEDELRIERRTTEMLLEGWRDEVSSLRDAGIDETMPAMQAIGYRTLLHHIDGKLSLEEATGQIVTETRQYAKRQRTWLRSEPNLLLLDPSEDRLAQARMIIALKEQ